MKNYTFGIDVGGTNIKVGLFKITKFELIEKIEFSTPQSEHETTIFDEVMIATGELLDKHHLSYDDIHGFGFAIPCPVKDGFVHKCPNLHWSNINVIKLMQNRLPDHVKIAVSNDANIAAYGENESLDIPHHNAIFYTLGTGVGGGIIVEGEIIEGRTGAGGEIGHMPIFDTDEVCGCGKSGCLEQVCGTKAILTNARKLMKNHQTILDSHHLTVKSIFDAAKKGDPVGEKVVDDMGKYIGLSASILAVSLDPDVIIIGGGIAKAGDILIDSIKKHYQLNARFNTTDVPIILAKTGNDAGIIGAAKYSMKT